MRLHPSLRGPGRAFRLSLIATLALAACGTDIQTATTSSSTGTSSSSSGHGGNPCFPDSCTGPSSGPGPGSTTGAGGGMVCGGLAGVQCPSDQYCDYSNDLCGGDDDQGICRPRPLGCDDNLLPTCGCDGKTYGNPCDANAAGVDRSNLGQCPPAPGSFNCGWMFCDVATQYCERLGTDIGGEPDAYGCKALPAACGATPSCMCLAGEPCGSLCTQDPGGHFTLTCPGG